MSDERRPPGPDHLPQDAGAALPDALRDLLSAERARPDLDAGRVEDAWKHVHARVEGVDPDDGDGGDGGGGGSGPSPGAPGASGGLSSLFGVKSTLIGVVVGAAIGFAAARVLAPPAPVAPVAAGPSPSVVAAPSNLEPSPAQSTVAVDPRAAPSATSAASSVGPSSTTPRLAGSPAASAGPTEPSSLKAERLLLERARAALLHDAPEQALEALAEHRARFADGQLADERDALERQAREMKAAP